MVAVRYQRSIDQLDTDGQNMALEELNRMERRCIIRICLEGYGENYEEKFIKQTKAWFEIKVQSLMVTWIYSRKHPIKIFLDAQSITLARHNKTKVHARSSLKK